MKLWKLPIFIYYSIFVHSYALANCYTLFNNYDKVVYKSATPPGYPGHRLLITQYDCGNYVNKLEEAKSYIRQTKYEYNEAREVAVGSTDQPRETRQIQQTNRGIIRPEQAREAEKASKAQLVLEAKQARKAEKARKAQLALEAKRAREAEKARKAQLALEDKQAREAEKARKAQLSLEAKQAREAEKARKAQLALEDKQAREAEKARKAQLALEAKQAREAEQAHKAQLALEDKQARESEIHETQEERDAVNIPQNVINQTPPPRSNSLRNMYNWLFIGIAAILGFSVIWSVLIFINKKLVEPLLCLFGVHKWYKSPAGMLCVHCGSKWGSDLRI